MTRSLTVAHQNVPNIEVSYIGYYVEKIWKVLYEIWKKYFMKYENKKKYEKYHILAITWK